MKAELTALLQRWERDAEAYRRQIEEARSKGLPHDCMLGTMSGIRECARDIKLLLKREEAKEKTP